ncbi:MAG: TlpA family protein disulfide reductase [Flavobacteriaceae bacterium]
MKTKILIVSLILINSLAFSQEYYIFENKKQILNQSELKKKIEYLNLKLKEKSSKKKTHTALVNYRIIDTYKRGDSIINKIRYDFKYVSTRNEKIYSFESKHLPEFNLKNLKSDRISSNSLKGKVTFINLWFTNCFPCVKEIPLLNILQSKFKNKVRFLAMTFDSKEKVKGFLKKKVFNYEHLVSAKSYLKNDLGNIAYPKIIILDKNGIVRYIGEGIPSEYDYEKRKMKDRTEKDLIYLEKILKGLI